MAKSSIRIQEHDKVSYDRLSSDQVDELEALVEQADARILTFHRDHLTSNQYVGVLQTPSLTLEIMPKGKWSGPGLLLALLRLTKTVSVTEIGQAGLRRLNGSFLQFWIEYFAQRLHKLLHRQLDRQYRDVERRTGFIRGRLRVEDMRSGREAITGKYPCRYEVYTADNRMNQVLLYCAKLLLANARSTRAQRLLRESCARLHGVSLRSVTVDDIDRIELSRLNDVYAPILRLCRLLLQNATASMRAGEVDQIAITFDMNQLFESAIGALLQRHQETLTIDGRPVKQVFHQHRLGQLYGEFSMYVDFVVRDDEGAETLIDTKYKRLSPMYRHGGLSQSDFYQMHAYATAGDRSYERVVLLYPGTTRISRRFETDNRTIMVRTVNLDRWTVAGSDRLDTPEMIRDLNRALQFS